MLSIEIRRPLTFKLLLLCIYFHTQIPLVLATSYFYSKICPEKSFISAHISTSFILAAAQCSIVWVGDNLFIIPPLGRHLDYLQSYAINNTAMNIIILVLFCICVAFHVRWMKKCLLIYIDSAKLTYQLILSYMV